MSQWHKRWAFGQVCAQFYGQVEGDFAQGGFWCSIRYVSRMKIRIWFIVKLRHSVLNQDSEENSDNGEYIACLYLGLGVAQSQDVWWLRRMTGHLALLRSPSLTDGNSAYALQHWRCRRIQVLIGGNPEFQASVDDPLVYPNPQITLGKPYTHTAGAYTCPLPLDHPRVVLFQV